MGQLQWRRASGRQSKGHFVSSTASESVLGAPAPSPSPFGLTSAIFCRKTATYPLFQRRPRNNSNATLVSAPHSLVWPPLKCHRLAGWQGANGSAGLRCEASICFHTSSTRMPSFQILLEMLPHHRVGLCILEGKQAFWQLDCLFLMWHVRTQG